MTADEFVGFCRRNAGLRSRSMICFLASDLRFKLDQPLVALDQSATPLFVLARQALEFVARRHRFTDGIRRISRSKLKILKTSGYLTHAEPELPVSRAGSRHRLPRHDLAIAGTARSPENTVANTRLSPQIRFYLW